MIQGVVTTQLTPVGVGWGNHVIAWLMTYQGGDCQLWRYVYSKCMEVELCREAMSLLPTIGYDLRRHKCVEDREDLDVVVTQPPNSTSKPTNTTPNNHPNPRSKLLPKLLNCLVNPQNNPELLPGSWVGLSPNAPLLIGGASLVGGLPPRAPAGSVAPRESPSVGRRWAGQWVGGSKAKTHRQAYPPNPMGR